MWNLPVLYVVGTVLSPDTNWKREAAGESASVIGLVTSFGPVVLKKLNSTCTAAQPAATLTPVGSRAGVAAPSKWLPVIDPPDVPAARLIVVAPPSISQPVTFRPSPAPVKSIHVPVAFVSPNQQSRNDRHDAPPTACE